MSILSVDNISPIGSGTSVTVNSAATLVLTNANSTGVVTATSFVGSGANLTNLPAQATIANNANNRVITGGSGVNLNGEANLTFNGNSLLVNNTSSNTAAHFKGAGGAGFIQITDSADSSTAFIGVDGGTLKFQTSGSSYSDKLTIDSSGNVTANTGNIIIGTAGKGIDFSATSGSGSSELFTDYEEGTYTPALTYDSSDSGNKSYQTRHGTYTKIGRVVTANFYVELNNKGTGNGAVAVSLPFTVGSYLNSTSLEAGGVIHYFTGLVNSWSDITLSALDGLARCRMYGISGQYGASTIGFEYSAMANTFNIRGSITYQST